CIEDPRNLAGNTCPHENAMDSGKHRPEQRGHRGELDLGEEVDPHQSVVVLAGKRHFHERRNDAEILRTHPVPMRVHRNTTIRAPRWTSAENEVSLEGPLEP